MDLGKPFAADPPVAHPRRDAAVVPPGGRWAPFSGGRPTPLPEVADDPIR